jgi:hypothetical protein
VLFAIFVQVAFHAGWIISAVVPLLALAAGLAGVFAVHLARMLRWRPAGPRAG